ncbi:MAG TPA: bifunctional hydroxymethylpyrimidine kinase/phosphomethylpyrimidine kinase [Symbiobacteriaceae bacterium]|nr:bifunctional hydroxymethylpyrimidine kinase/phosphomethylpyrimidine kinase [Symbiobacteriaceae bacterium]
MTLARALTIAGSDSGGGAGIQADLKTFTVLGVYGMTALTAITAQNTSGVSGVYPLSPEAVQAQLDAVLSDIGTDAAKTGMLFDVPIIEVVADRIKRHGVRNLVLDPVMIAKGGQPLLLPRAQAALRDLLLPLAAVITPNLPEAEVLTGMEIKTKQQMVDAGRHLLALGAGAAVIKGGHLEGQPADDVLVTRDGELWLQAERVESRHTHGTGCTFSAAIAAGLARGMALEAAVKQAKAFITLAIRKAPGFGAGHGPTNHLAWLGEGRS